MMHVAILNTNRLVAMPNMGFLLVNGVDTEAALGYLKWAGVIHHAAHALPPEVWPSPEPSTKYPKAYHMGRDARFSEIQFANRQAMANVLQGSQDVEEIKCAREYTKNSEESIRSFHSFAEHAPYPYLSNPVGVMHR
jgi:hypothetical protein